jgi:hypothetical protein
MQTKARSKRFPVEADLSGGQARPITLKESSASLRDPDFDGFQFQRSSQTTYSAHVTSPPVSLPPASRTWLVSILTGLFIAVTAHAHVVQQLFAEVKGSGADWELEVLFDAGYAKPEWRGDPDSPQSTRDWLVSLALDEQLLLCEETSRYLNECLTFEQDGALVNIRHHFIDFDQSPPDFPNLLNDGAYLRVRLTPPPPDSGSPVICRLAEGRRPDFVFKTTDPDDPEPKYLTLRPGETFVLHQGKESLLSQSAERSVTGESVCLYSMKQGFLHVLPVGLDHILFILVLFLLQRSWKPLLWQSLAFTVAHTLTLGLTAAGIIAPKSSGVEALIAFSIVVLALENLFKKECSTWRIAVVFCFGLIHGMGFATALSSLLTPGEGFLGRLIATNLGVEFAQVTILGLAWLLTAKWCESPHYATFRSVLNGIIALIASVWLIERFAASV